MTDEREGKLPGIDYPCPDGDYDADDIDRVYDQVDDMLRAGRCTEVDALLERVDVTQCSITIMLSYLTITGPARDLLKNRAAFYDRVHERLGVIDKPRRADLLQGLR